MKQIIIRRDIVPAVSSHVHLMGYDTYIVPITCLENADDLLKSTVKETVAFSTLLQEYQKAFMSQESSLFVKMYQINKTSGIVIDQNIYLYHCDHSPVWITHEDSKWAYMSSKKYIGDSWWFDDSEILSDIQKLTIVEFLEKYKGY